MTRIATILLCLILTQAHAAHDKTDDPVFNTQEIRIIKNNFFHNITEQGAILASPSTAMPNYSYDWIRDSAIAMGLIASWYEAYDQDDDKIKLLNYVSWTQKIQQQPDPNPEQDILGEPKFNLDSTPYAGPWGRPQNDGPALRALALMHFANALLKKHHDDDYVRSHLYAGGLDPRTMGAIKLDLEYVAHHWHEPNYDLWEEVYGHHFFTEMVQRKALLEGAQFARNQQDASAADYYQQQALKIETDLNHYIDHSNNLIRASLVPHPGPQKDLELDSAVILGVLIGNAHDTVFAANNDYVKNTVIALKQQFKVLFPINHEKHTILFGRYPGDTYDGYQTGSVGNPWFLLTASVAEYYYIQGKLLPNTPENRQRREHAINQGDHYLKLIKQYAPDLTMKEQINLNTGEQQGATSLTWGYVALLRAIDARSQLTKLRSESFARQKLNNTNSL